MKVVVKATHITHGGGLTHLNKMIEWFGKLAPNDEFVLIGKEGQQRIFVAAPENFEYRFYRVPSLNLGARLFWEKAVFPRMLKFLKPDLLFEPGNTGTLNAYCPRVSLVHNIAPFDDDNFKIESFYQKFRNRMLRWETTRNLKTSSGIIVLSQYCRDFFQEYIDYNNSKVAVIYHGSPDEVPSDRDDRYLSELGVTSNYLLCVSHVYRYKKLKELVNAYLIALETNPALPNLYVAGKIYDQEYMNQINEIISKSNLSGKVHFLGQVDSKPLQALYRNCTGFLFSSALETCSVILVEALSNGCAIACSNKSVVPEICADAAVYFDPNNIEDIAAKIRLLCEDKKLNESLRSKAEARGKNFSWKKSAEQTLNLFNDVLMEFHSCNQITASKRHQELVSGKN